jgi:hypothetical protein
MVGLVISFCDRLNGDRNWVIGDQFDGNRFVAAQLLESWNLLLNKGNNFDSGYLATEFQGKNS